MHDLIQINMLPMMCCLFMLFFLYKNNSFEQQVKVYFIKACIAILILIVADAWEGREAVRTYPTKARVIASILGYSVRPVMAYFVCRAAMKVKKIRFKYVFALPLFINTLVACSALISPMLFTYDAANQFVRGPLGWIPFVTGMFYAISIYYISRKLISRVSLEEAQIVLFIVVIIIGATMIESMYHFKAFLSGGCCIGLVFYYLYLNINISEHDVLTGAKVRRNFYLDVEKNKTNLSAVISLDLNGLKTLNDTYGHCEGDKALVTLAHIARNFMPGDWGFYRTGGDEFMILCYKADEDTIEKFICKFNEELERHSYSAATGYVMYKDDMDFDEVCRCCDQKMYETKRKMKEQTKD